VLEVNVQPAPVHRVVSLAPKDAVSEFMGYLKGQLARRGLHPYEPLGQRFWGRPLGATGYCVSPIGLDDEQVRKYVKWQEDQEKQAELVQRRLFD
jgi:putative transposase